MSASQTAARANADGAFVFPAATVAGWLIGVALDRWLHTTWLYLAGLILGIIAAVKTFAPGLVIKLNPRTSGTFLQVLIYGNAFAGGNSKMGYASAEAMVLLLIVFALTIFEFRFLRPKV